MQEWLKCTRGQTTRHQVHLRWGLLPSACENYFVGSKDCKPNVEKVPLQTVVHVFAAQQSVLFTHVLPLFIIKHRQTRGQASPRGIVSQTCSRFLSEQQAALVLCDASMMLGKDQSVLVKYQATLPWQERVPVHPDDQKRHGVASPEYELSPETLRSPPRGSPRLLPGSRVLPPAAGPTDVVLVDGDGPAGGFSDEERDQFVAEARLLAERVAPDELTTEVPALRSGAAQTTVFKGPGPTGGHVWVVPGPPVGSVLQVADVLRVLFTQVLDSGACHIPVAGCETAVACQSIEVGSWEECVVRYEHDAAIAEEPRKAREARNACPRAPPPQGPGAPPPTGKGKGKKDMGKVPTAPAGPGAPAGV